MRWEYARPRHLHLSSTFKYMSPCLRHLALQTSMAVFIPSCSWTMCSPIVMACHLLVWEAFARDLKPRRLTLLQGSYTPPPCTFNRVTMNFTVVSKGRQFDRLGIMYLGDIEVFRTSTAEPTKDGIVWTYVREMDQYDVLWKSPQKIIFDLGNLINNIYTGSFNATLTATFFTVPGSRAVADTILPISARQSASNQPSAFDVPGQNASVAYQLPQNIEKAVVSLSACGQSTEEFWYTNAFSSQVDTFDSTAGTLYGYSPFREVQLLIDGQLAGVSWPFPIIFTGGIVPGLWRPIVGIDAFDLREHEIDITPWLPLLCDGGSHTFEIRVAGLNDDGAGHAILVESVGSFWIVTGKIFLFLDKNGSVTTGSAPKINAPAPQIQISSTITKNATGANETLAYNTAVKRTLAISSTAKTSSGSHPVSWTQDLTYSNYNDLTAQGFVQLTTQFTTGTDNSASGYANTYSYPLNVTSSFSIDAAGDLGLTATLTRGLDFNVFGPSVFPSGIQNFNISSPSTFSVQAHAPQRSIHLPKDSLPFFSGSLLSTTQTASAEYFSAGNRSYSFGTTEQDFSFKGAEVDGAATYELYRRHVKAVNSTVTEDSQTLAGQTFEVPTAVGGESPVLLALEGFSVRALLGRGPGATKAELGGGGK